MIDAKQRLEFWKLAIVALCLCVFVFATNARLVQCAELPTSVASVSAGNFWPTDHRMEVQTSVELAALVVVAIATLLGSLLARCSSPVRSISPTPLSAFEYWHLRRFFRPPPGRVIFLFS